MTRFTRNLIRGTVPVAALAFGLAFAGPASADTVAFNAYDSDGNGYVDGYGFDASGDGYEDTWAFDSDEDGWIEEVGVDTTYNGLPDVWGADENYDGYADWLYYDTNDDGSADYYEAAYDTAYAYASVTYVFVEAGDWTYWEVSYETGYGYDLTARDGDGAIGTLADQPAAALTATPDAADVAEDALHDLLPAFF